eukprot:gene36409-54910_t
MLSEGDEVEERVLSLLETAARLRLQRDRGPLVAAGRPWSRAAAMAACLRRPSPACPIHVVVLASAPRSAALAVARRRRHLAGHATYCGVLQCVFAVPSDAATGAERAGRTRHQLQEQQHSTAGGGVPRVAASAPDGPNITQCRKAYRGEWKNPGRAAKLPHQSRFMRAVAEAGAGGADWLVVVEEGALVLPYNLAAFLAQFDAGD